MITAEHRQFNEFVQRAQSDCMAWRAEWRNRYDGSRNHFEVYWDGRWRTLAIETPFVVDRAAIIFDMEWATIQAEMAGALATS